MIRVKTIIILLGLSILWTARAFAIPEGNGNEVFPLTNVGIGTLSPFGGGLIVLPANTGNVGIGSLTPGQALDVRGTVRMTGLTLNLNPAAGYVIVGNGVGVGTWMPASTLPISGVSGTNFWLNDTGNVGINTTYNIGIGTIAQVNALNILGNIGIGTFSYDPYMLTQAPSGGMIVSGNVGIGTWAPGGALIVQGGKVGIGTTAPSALFDVNGNSILGTAASSTDTITSSGSGSLAGGYAQHFLGNSGIITSSNIGSFAFGSTFGSGGNNGSIIANSNGAIAMGYANTGTIESNGNASLAIGYSSGGGTLQASNVGSVAIGAVFNTGTLMSSGAGAIAMGIANGGATLESSGTGSIAMGDSTGTLQATGNGSVAIGQNVQATSALSFALGLNVVNPTASSFMVGFSTTPALTVTNTTVGVGIGTYTTPSGGLDVLGNVGIGTFSPFGGGLIVLPANTGNVGIGSLTPGQALDVKGTIRDLGEIVNGNVGIGTSFINGAGEGALTVMGGNVGIGTWLPADQLDVEGTLSITNLGGNVNVGGAYITFDGPSAPGNTIWTSGNNLEFSAYSQFDFGRGQGANFTEGGGSAEVSIEPGTTGPSGTQVLISGNSGQASFGTSNNLLVAGGVAIGNYAVYPAPNAPVGGVIISGNVGIGSAWPGTELDVTGTVRTTSFTMSGQTPISGYVLTASDSSGDVTWSSPGAVGGWTTSGSNVYETSGGNVGIGTSLLTTAALTVMNGNVGIGTWVPSQALQVNGKIAFTTSGVGNLLISDNGGGTATISNSGNTYLNIVGGVSGTYFSSNVGIGTTASTAQLAVVNGSATSLPANSGSTQSPSILEFGAPGNAYLYAGYYSVTNAFWFQNSNLGSLNINYPLLFNPNGGNVGIGSVTPGVALDVTGSIRASTVNTVNITSTPYTIANSQNDIYFTYTDAAAGTINLPALSGLSTGFTVTIARQVPQSLTIAANGSDTFPNTLGSLEMQSQNIATITLMKAGSFWTIVNQTADCVVGQSCWNTNMIYAGIFNGHQYFTTPGGCNNSSTPTCAGGTDTLTLAYADGSGGSPANGNVTTATNTFYGGGNTTTLVGYTDTKAATFCHNLNYAGHTDWYLPASFEMLYLYENAEYVSGLKQDTTLALNYLTSTEYTTTGEFLFVMSSGALFYGGVDTTPYYVRCVRRY